MAQDIDRILALASTVRLQMDVLKRRVQRKPGHQNITPHALLKAARDVFDLLERELGVPEPKAIVEVSGGVAEVTTCPAGFAIEIIDHDNNEEMGV